MTVTSSGPQVRRVDRTSRVDSVAAAGIRSEASPYLVLSPDGMTSRLNDEQTRASWLADRAGEPVGFATLRRPTERGASRLAIMVVPSARRVGVGRALLAAALHEMRGEEAAVAGVADEPSGVAFAVREGFELGRRHRFSTVDPQRVPDPPLPPDDVALVPLADVDPYDVWRLHSTTAVDDPSGLSIEQPFDVWRAEDWDFPDHAPELGMAARTADGDLVAFTHVFADRARGALWSAMTGVHPDARGRGLARLVKAASLRRARDAGYTLAATANAEENAPMLAVNTWLGYRVVATAWSVRRG